MGKGCRRVDIVIDEREWSDMVQSETVSLILTSYNCKDSIFRTLCSIEMQD